MKMYVHVGCGGNVSVDFGSLMSLKASSLVPTPGGFRAGVMEFRTKTYDAKLVKLVCDKCGEETALTNMAKFVDMECVICGRKRPIAEMKTSSQFSCTCSSCTGAIQGKNEPPNERARRELAAILIRGSGIEFHSVLSVVNNPINF